MHCNGKCHLAKEFKKQENREKNNPVNPRSESEILLFYSSGLVVESPEYVIQNNKFKPYTGYNSEAAETSVFHPPLA